MTLRSHVAKKGLEEDGPDGTQVIEVNDSDPTPDNKDPHYLVNDLKKDLQNLFGPGEKLDFILQSPYVRGEHDDFVAFYVDEGNNNFPIQFVDFRRYNSELFIRDTVIDGFFWLLNEQFRSTDLAFGKSYWYSRYMVHSDANSNQLKKVMSGVHDDMEKLFLPIFIHGNHWILGVIHFTVRLVEIYDSLDGNNEDVASVIVNRMSDLYGKRKFWTFQINYRNSTIQRQNDNHNCAFFTCWYAYQLATNNPITPWDGDWDGKVKTIRRNVMNSLVTRFIAM
jgi:Ulp1 family protease